MTTKPITPDQAAALKLNIIPDTVIECFNEMIAMNLTADGGACFRQDDVVALIRARLPDANPFESHWLDVEPLYEKAGWTVGYDKPAYNETYSATFTFTRKLGRR